MKNLRLEDLNGVTGGQLKHNHINREIAGFHVRGHAVHGSRGGVGALAITGPGGGTFIGGAAFLRGGK